MKGFRADVYASPDIPQGHDTVWGWLAKNEPEALYFMEQPGLDALEFEEEAQHIAVAEDIIPMALPSPPAVVESGGLDRVLAFPNVVLRAVFARR